MSQWIAFDEESTAIAALVCKTAVQFQHGSALDFALGTGNSGVLIIPSQREGMLHVALMRHLSTQHSDVATRQPSGILGLSDEIVFEQAANTEERSWWRRLLEWAH